ncbi:MAG: site-2 protease family protein [Gemmatimonadota bacterium]
MKQSIRLGRIAGVPVGVHWSVLVIVALIGGILGASVLPAMVPHQPVAAYWAVAVPGALLFVAALLAHELAHAVVARRKGVPVRSITLWALGGVAELGGDPPTARADLQIAVAGPATSLAAGLVFGGLWAIVRAADGPALLSAALFWLAVMNGLLAVFNLLPGAPLDGGRILRAALWFRYRDRTRAARAAANAGRVVGVLLIAVGVGEFLAWRDAGGLWLGLIGMFVISAAAAEAANETAAAALAGLRVRDVMTPDPAVGASWMTVTDFISRVAMHSSQGVFPVVAFDGTVAGVTSVDLIGRVPAEDRAITPLGRVMLPVPAEYLAGPDDPAAPLLGRRPLAGELSAIVTDEGRIVGLVTVENLRRVVRRAALRAEPAHAGPSA